MHIHVYSSDGEAKFWLEPDVGLAKNYGFSESELLKLQKIIEERRDEIQLSWKKHLSR